MKRIFKIFVFAVTGALAMGASSCDKAPETIDGLWGVRCIENGAPKFAGPSSFEFAEVDMDSGNMEAAAVLTTVDPQGFTRVYPGTYTYQPSGMLIITLGTYPGATQWLYQIKETGPGELEGRSIDLKEVCYFVR